MEDHPPNCTATSSSSAATAPARKSSLSAECERCVSYLTRALDRTGSKQQALLRAMGVVMQRSDGEEEKIYRRSQDGRGILVQIRSSASASTAMSVSSKSSENHSNDAVGADSHREAVRRRTTSNIKEQQQQTITNNENDTTTLRNRLTKAASHLVEGIRHSADDIINIHNNNDGGVLSTSPNDDNTHINNPHNDTSTPKPTITTIAIECQQCGSDTRAEAGARAYVKGPDPLSIILCSNRLSSQRQVNEVLTHELIHIYDIKQKHMDLTNCQQLAYSEVRAAREAECGNSLTKNMQRICSKDKATVATRNMFPEEGRVCVCSVFDEAVEDYMPFGVKRGKRSLHRASDR